MDTSILGIDVASRKLDLCWSNGKSLEHTQIDYAQSALDAYLKHHPKLRPTSCTVGLESTGDYHLQAAQYFLRRKFPVYLINPLLTRYYTKLTIRGTKTDTRDAELICKLVAEGHGRLLIWADVTNRDKELMRLAQTLTEIRVQLAQRLASTQRKSLVGTKRFERKVERIIERLRALSDEIVAAATTDPSVAEQLITSIPGFGAKLAANVHHELGNIQRFKNAKSLVAYAGLDPRIKQSGRLLNTTGHLTKRGSASLRHALFLAANVARRYDSELAAYYAQKRAMGRTHREILCIISRKLLYRINALLRSHRPYSVLVPPTEMDWSLIALAEQNENAT